MTRGTRIVNEVLHSQIVLLATTVATLVGFAVTIWPGTLNQWLFYIPLTAFIACVLYSFFVRLDNQALRDCAKIIHELNHTYRDVLCDTLKQDANHPENNLLEIERAALEVACHRIEKLYFGLIGKPCIVSVKLITFEGGKPFCSTLARSELNCARDKTLLKLEVNTGNNTAYDTAIKVMPGISHYYAADLFKEEEEMKYSNQRTGWKRHYRSMIVVPIRHVRNDQLGAVDACDTLGFLGVDTLTKNRLNNGFHLEYLAAFADQMYNFMSLMRGKYRLKQPPIQQLLRDC